MNNKAVLVICALATPSAVAQTNLQDCEACGLLVWRLQVIAAKTVSNLQHVKRASEKKARKSTTNHEVR